MANSKITSLDKLFNYSYITLTSTDNLNDLPRSITRLYYLQDGTNRPINCPPDAQYAHLITLYYYQIIIDNVSPAFYLRRYTNNTWSTWSKFDGTKLNV